MNSTRRKSLVAIAAILVTVGIVSFAPSVQASPGYLEVIGIFFYALIAWFIITIILAIWVYGDAEARGKSGAIWLLIFLITGLLGLIIWLIVRPKEIVKPEEKKCIIATCVLPPQHPDLQYLRRFRDEVLESTKLGRLIVWLYYALSPPIALILRASKRMKKMVRKRFIPFWIRICKEWEKKAEDK